MNDNNIAIEVRNISKLYRIGTKDDIHENFVHAVLHYLKSPLKNFKKYRALYNFNDVRNGDNDNSVDTPSDIIYAVNDVSFDVHRGEVLGIIGRNGAGKSTLLKILSRITSPSNGRIEARGKISCLLEVGTGFHVELTGRENIYLNGTILGMGKREIDQKFDQIVEFSNIGKFLDTPVKRYSSGMKVRLAFSVAAHLDPEILIIDEVLAVGDADFQKKCLGRMDQVAKGGKTVLFVSHDMRAIANLCDRVLLIENGSVTDSGSPLKVIEKYLTSGQALSSRWFATGNGQPDSPVHLLSAMVLSPSNEPTDMVKYDDGFNVGINYTISQPIENMVVFVRIADFYGNDIWASQDADETIGESNTKLPGKYSSICKVPSRLMRPGRYKIHIGAMAPGKMLERHMNAITFDISDVGYPLPKTRKGIITPIFQWETKKNGISDVEAKN